MPTFEKVALGTFAVAFGYLALHEVLGRGYAPMSPAELKGYRNDKTGARRAALTLTGVLAIALLIGSMALWLRDSHSELGIGLWLAGCLIILREVHSVPSTKRSCVHCGNTLEVYRDSSLPRGNYGYVFVCHPCKKYYVIVTGRMTDSS